MNKSVVVTAMLGALCATACERGTSAPTDNDTMHITLPNSDLSLVAGSAATVRVVIVRNGYDGLLTVRAEGVPVGVTVDDVVVPDQDTEALLLFATSPTTAPGVTSVSIRAEPVVDSVAPSVRELRLSIRPPGAFMVSAEPVSIVPGTTSSTAVTVSRTGGFTGTVTLTASAPLGLIASMQPHELSGTASTALLSIIADPGVRPGAYFVRITAASPGFVEEVFDLVVTVTGS